MTALRMGGGGLIPLPHSPTSRLEQKAFPLVVRPSTEPRYEAEALSTACADANCGTLKQRHGLGNLQPARCTAHDALRSAHRTLHKTHTKQMAHGTAQCTDPDYPHGHCALRRTLGRLHKCALLRPLRTFAGPVGSH